MLEDVGRNLRKLRRDREFTQGQLARFAKMRQQEVSAIEHGFVPPLALVDRLARALGVSANELLRPAADPRPSTGRRDVDRLEATESK